jgi:hypothetical protein
LCSLRSGHLRLWRSGAGLCGVRLWLRRSGSRRNPGCGPSGPGPEGRSEGCSAACGPEG